MTENLPWQWIGIIVLFLGFEFEALFNKKGADTWSEVVRYIFGFSKRSQVQGWRMRVRRGSFYALAVWFTGHIGGWLP